ncbi:hypothetical protein ACFWXK_25045 [Streptomyces sp. NPDC059070]|uniref:hypothetical protein n=1 Tax=Streptomyces sp. NPDC059070 TaxID=3346713 RepID=UPI0036A45FAF
MLPNMTTPRRFGAGVSTLVAAAMVGTVISGTATAADPSQEKETQAAVSALQVGGTMSEGLRIGMPEADLIKASATFGSDLSGISDEKGVAAVQHALDLIGSIPESLIQRIEAGDQRATQEVADFLK